MAKSPAWQRAEGKNPKGGLNAKGRASAKAQGMNLKPPVKKAEAAKKAKVAKVMKEFKAGTLNSGSSKGPIVKGKKQAVAIALSQAKMSNKKMGKKK